MKVNGEELCLISGETVSDLLTREKYDAQRIVVELNNVIVKKELYSSTILKDDDIIEVISFVGGG